MPPLHEWAERGNDFRILVQLLQAGEDPNITDAHGIAPLHYVARRSEENNYALELNLTLAHVLIGYGADVNVRGTDLTTPLIEAVRSLNVGMIIFLLSNNARVDLTNNKSNTPLHCAVNKCTSSLSDGYDVEHDKPLLIVRTLLAAGSRLEERNTNGKSALFIAVEKKNLPIVLELLKHGADVNSFGPYDMYPFYVALNQENIYLDMVVELMRHESLIDFKTSFKLTPLEAYLDNLCNAPYPNDSEKAKYVFKLFLFCECPFTLKEERSLRRLSRARNYSFTQYIENCELKVSQMARDVVTPVYTVYSIALNGFHRSPIAHDPNANEIILNKLLICEYYYYSDLIANSICTNYVQERLFEMCSRRRFLYEHLLDRITSYLSNYDMVNMMLAFS